MAQDSKIEWTNHSNSIWWGCTEVHEGCDHCYAAALSNRWGNDLWGNDKARKEIKNAFANFLKYQNLAKAAGEIHRVFVGSMMDIFEKPMTLINSKGEPLDYTTEKLRQQLFTNIDAGLYSHLLQLFLTKRETNINKYIPEHWKLNPPSNVMFGATAVNQATLDRVIKNLQAVNGRKFLSIEPQLDLIKLGKLEGIDWIIQGGESGPKKRPFNLDWARSMRDEALALGIPYFFKQIDKVQDIPTDLQIRQFPNHYINAS
ncbi:DUF5131 family protein [Runella sp.]|uniref:DUF5131 family protein n=1 Tax=Runella sp. TaxID=1960881 RepID=UPI003D0D32CA